MKNSKELKMFNKEMRFNGLPIIQRKDEKMKVVEKHDKISREVKDEDVSKVVEDGQLMIDLCKYGCGKYQSAFAVAHAQVEDKDPLRFFVLDTGMIIVNPVMTRHTNTEIDSEEACLTFSLLSPKIVQRYNKCEFDFQTIVDDKDGNKKLSEKTHASLEGKDSKVWQHETDHLDAKYIY